MSLDVLETLPFADVENHNDGMRVGVKLPGNGSEYLLASRVPNLKLDQSIGVYDHA